MVEENLNETGQLHGIRVYDPDDPGLLQTASDQDLIALYDESERELEELEARLTVIRQEFLARLKEKKQDSQIVENGADKWTVTPFLKVNVSNVSEETAKDLGAWKKVVTEKIDSAVLKALHKKGIEVPGLSFDEFVRIVKMEAKDDNA